VKLTNQQVQDLYKFTRQHYVEYYDVQTELVDHLANDIEQIWEKEPNLSFEKARDKSFKKFGVFGFMGVLEEKQKAMSKKYLKILWGFAKEWFQLPKIIITLSSVCLLFLLLSSSYGMYIYYGILLFFLGFLLEKYIHLRKISKERFQKTNKKWMLEHMIYVTTSANIFVFISNLFNSTHAAKHLDNVYITLIVSVLFVSAFLIAYITLVVIPQKGEKLLEEVYPEYKLVTNS